MLVMKAWFLLINCILLMRNGRSSDVEPDELIAQNRALHYFYVDGRVPEATLIRFLHPLLSELDINKFVSKFTILDAADGSIIVPESSTLTGWQTSYKPTGRQKLNLTVIELSIMSYTKSKAVVQRPANFFIITKETEFDDEMIKRLKDGNRNGEIFIFTPNAEDPKRQIYNMSNPEIYLDVIKNAVLKQPIWIYPQRTNLPFVWDTTIDRNTYMALNVEGIQSSSSSQEYILLIDGTKAAPLYISTNSKMEEFFGSDQNIFEISLNNDLTTLYLKTITSNDIYDCYEDDCRFIDSSRIVLETIRKPKQL